MDGCVISKCIGGYNPIGTLSSNRDFVNIRGLKRKKKVSPIIKKIKIKIKMLVIFPHNNG